MTGSTFSLIILLSLCKCFEVNSRILYVCGQLSGFLPNATFSFNPTFSLLGDNKEWVFMMLFSNCHIFWQVSNVVTLTFLAECLSFSPLFSSEWSYFLFICATFHCKPSLHMFPGCLNRPDWLFKLPSLFPFWLRGGKKEKRVARKWRVYNYETPPRSPVKNDNPNRLFQT